MIIKTKEIYICEYCRKLYQIKKACKKHEPMCKKNPDNKQKCYDFCIYLCKKEIEYIWESWDGEHQEKKEILFCNAKEEGVFPYWINGLEQEDIIENIPNNPMPKKCKLFKSLL